MLSSPLSPPIIQTLNNGYLSAIRASPQKGVHAFSDELTRQIVTKIDMFHPTFTTLTNVVIPSSGLSVVPVTQNGYTPVSIGMSINNVYVACTDGTTVYMSSDAGITWTSHSSSTDGQINTVCVSNTGQYVVFCVAHEAIYVSANYGSSFTVYASDPWWSSVAISSTGQYMVATTYSDHQIYKSSDYGHTWSVFYTNGSYQFVNCAISTDGSYICFLAVEGAFFMFHGTTLIYSDSTLVRGNSCAMSASGQYVAYGSNSGIYVSSNYGQSWTLSVAGFVLSTVSMSASGQVIIATSGGSGTYFSANYGQTWTPDFYGQDNFTYAICSYDGYYAYLINDNSLYLGTIQITVTTVNTTTQPKFVYGQSTDRSASATMLKRKYGQAVNGINMANIVITADSHGNDKLTVHDALRRLRGHGAVRHKPHF